MRNWTLILLIVITFVSFAQAESLFLFGGGTRPQMALQQLVAKAGKSPILVITWATNDPEGSFQALSTDLKLAGAWQIEQAPQTLTSQKKRARFLKQVAEAGAIFFSGGDQNLALNVIDQFSLREPLQHAFFSGTPFAGTSAGTALMPVFAMKGGSPVDMPELREGLGLIEYFVDQHFIIRGREPRLRALVHEYEISGIGVDEGMAAVVEDKILHVIGPTAVEVFIPQLKGIQKISLVHGQLLRLDFQR